MNEKRNNFKNYIVQGDRKLKKLLLKKKNDKNKFDLHL